MLHEKREGAEGEKTEEDDGKGRIAKEEEAKKGIQMKTERGRWEDAEEGG